MSHNPPRKIFFFFTENCEEKFFFTENCEEKFFLGGYDSPLEEKIFFPVFHPKLVGFHFFYYCRNN